MPRRLSVVPCADVLPPGTPCGGGVTVPTDHSSLLALAFEASPEPLAIVEGDLIHARNAAWRAQLGDASSLCACVDPADHPVLAAALAEARRGRASLAARISGAPDDASAPPAAGARSFTLWPAGDATICVRLDDVPRAPPEPRAAEPLSPASVDATIASKERALAHLFESMDALLWAIRRDGTISLAEGNALAHYRLKPGMLVGSEVSKMFPPESRAYKTIMRTLAGESMRTELAEQGVHWVSFMEPVRGEGGEVEAAIGLSININEHLHETRNAHHLTQIINSLPLAVWATDANYICTMSAGRALEKLGTSAGQRVGQDLREAYSAHPEILDIFRRVHAGETVIVEMPLRGRHWMVSYYPARNGVGEIVGHYGVSQDITDRKQDELRMREQLATIEAQQRAIAELVSPVIEVWSGVLVVPLIGALTDDRAAVLAEHLLERVVHRGAAFAILDLTGVDALDARQAEHLVRVLRSLDLLGCACLFSGLRPSVASAMVTLDLEIPEGRTHPTLAEALRRCLRSDALQMQRRR